MPCLGGYRGLYVRAFYTRIRQAYQLANQTGSTGSPSSTSPPSSPARQARPARQAPPARPARPPQPAQPAQTSPSTRAQIPTRTRESNRAHAFIGTPKGTRPPLRVRERRIHLGTKNFFRLPCGWPRKSRGTPKRLERKFRAGSVANEKNFSTCQLLSVFHAIMVM